MNRYLCPALCAFMLAAGAAYSTPVIRVDLDMQDTADEWTVRYLFVGTTPDIRVYFFENGAATTMTGYSGYMWYGTNELDSASIVQIDATMASTYADFNFASSDLTTAGVWLGGVVMTNATDTIEWGHGRLHVQTSPGTGNPGTLDLGAVLNWALYSSYLGDWPFTVTQVNTSSNGATGADSATGYTTTISFNTNVTHVAQTIAVQDPTNGIAYWIPTTKAVTLNEVYVKTVGMTGLVDIITQPRTAAWYTYTTIATGITATAAGTSGSTFGTADIADNYRIGFIASGLSAFVWTNQIQVDFHLMDQ